jgi:hypothetical protein
LQRRESDCSSLESDFRVSMRGKIQAVRVLVEAMGVIIEAFKGLKMP